LSLRKKETTIAPSRGKKQVDEYKLVRDNPFYGTTATAGDHFLSSSMARVPERERK
jgi:hypothetical protein